MPFRSDKYQVEDSLHYRYCIKPLGVEWILYIILILQAPNVKTKEKWVKNIKVLLMESIPGLPDKVCTCSLEMGTTSILSFFKYRQRC